MSDLQAFCNFGPFPHPEAYEVRIITERGWFHTASSLACMNSIRKVKNKLGTTVPKALPDFPDYPGNPI